MHKQTAGETPDVSKQVIFKVRFIEHRGPTDNGLKGRRILAKYLSPRAMLGKGCYLMGGRKQ